MYEKSWRNTWRNSIERRVGGFGAECCHRMYGRPRFSEAKKRKIKHWRPALDPHDEPCRLDNVSSSDMVGITQAGRDLTCFRQETRKTKKNRRGEQAQ